MEPTIDDLQAQIDRLNRTIREWREQQAPQAPAGDQLSLLGDRGAEILNRWEATDQRYSQAVNEIESRLTEWGAMESRLHRDALERVRSFERTMQGEWQALRQMHEEPLKQLQEQAAALGETCVAAANLSLRGYERAEARLAALEHDLRTQLTELSQEVRTALVEVRRAALPPAAPAEPFQLDSVMRLHEEMRNAAVVPSETVTAASRFGDGPRAVETPRTIDIPRPSEASRPVEAAEVAEVAEIAQAEPAPRPIEVTWPVESAPWPVEAARASESAEPVVMWPRPVPSPMASPLPSSMPSAATAPAVAPDVKLPAPFAVPTDGPVASPRTGPSRLPDSTFPLNEETGERRGRRRVTVYAPPPPSAANKVGRLAAAGVAIAVIVIGVFAFGRMGSVDRQGSPTLTASAPTATPDPAAAEAPVPPVSPAPAPQPVAAAPLPTPDNAEVVRQHTLDILASPDVVRLLLAGVGTADGATAQVMWSRAQGMILTASRLPVLPDGMTYRLSLRGAAGNVPVTDFTSDAAGRARLVADNPAGMPSPVHGALITIEATQANADSTGIVALERGTR